jgi:hypothetical protein
MQPGDRVRFLDHVGEAVVVRVLAGGRAVVEDELGIVAEYALRELVPIGGKAPQQSTRPVAQPIAPKPEPAKETIARPMEKEGPLPELALVFRLEENGDGVELHFRNGSEHDMLLHVGAKEETGLFSVFRGEVREGEMKYLRSFRRQDVDIFGLTAVDCIFYKESDYQHREAFSALLKLKSTRFVKEGSFARSNTLGGMVLVVAVEPPKSRSAAQLTDHFPRPVIKPLSKKPEAPVFDIEVDLHIEKLVTDHGSLSDFEMLTCQLRCASDRIDRGLRSDLLSITFIHGVGSGRLRDEVRKLAAEYGLRCEEGDFRRYGAGATVVLMDRG